MRRIAIFLVLLTACSSAPAPLPAPVSSTPVGRQPDEPHPQPTIARAVSAVSVPAPADAVVLFDGGSLDAWTDAATGGRVRWTVHGGSLEITPGTRGIRTREGYGDVQLHIEWAAPLPPVGDGQDRGNSGVLFMGLYEVQILDSYGNNTFADGQAGSVYGQSAPLVNASLPPGEWQNFDIVFRRPRFEGDRLVRPARITVFHNGVLVQDNVELTGPTSHPRGAPYHAHGDRLPLVLEGGSQKVRFRNIWLREVQDR